MNVDEKFTFFIYIKLQGTYLVTPTLLNKDTKLREYGLNHNNPNGCAQMTTVTDEVLVLAPLLRNA